MEKATTLDDWQPPFAGGPAPMSGGPPWLFWVKCGGDAIVKALTGLFHLLLFNSAMPYQETYLGDAPGLGHIFTALHADQLTLSVLMAFLLTLGALIIPVIFWYVSETNKIFDDPQGFWTGERTNGIVFVSIVAIFIGLQIMEFSLLFQRLDAAADVVEIGGIKLDDEETPNFLTMTILSCLVMGLNFLFGWVSARLIIQLEKGEVTL